jgi:hypothetical protein
MSSAVRALMRAGVSVKMAQLSRAFNSYVKDRAEQGQSRLVSYAIGAGFYVGAGIFLIAALIVGATALFRWVEIKYGLFPAFFSMIGLLLLLMIICVVIAIVVMRPKKERVVSLGSRMRVAMNMGANPPRHLTDKRGFTPSTPADPVRSARNTAHAVLRAPASPMGRADDSGLAPKAGIAAAIGLLGWAIARRYSRPAPRRPAAPRS